MNTIIINSKHKAQGQTNRFDYPIPSSVKFDKDDQVALQSIAMYNSIFNIEAVRGNHQIKMTFPSSPPQTETFTFPDGFYDINSMNYFLQQQCILKQWYLVDANKNNVYYIELVQNTSQYACQLNLSLVPTATIAQSTGNLAKALTKPSGATWNFPAIQTLPTLEILTQTFGDLIGFKQGVYPVGSTKSYISTTTPAISPVNSILLGCNLINSPFCNPSNLFYSIPITTAFGGLIHSQNTSPIFNHISAGLYNIITITFYDQNFEALRLRDFEIVIVLSVIKQRETNSMPMYSNEQFSRPEITNGAGLRRYK